ncbi:MAG: hypothetical protein JXR37_01595 [Kiritimatiellae bacterium]|nr:hypothetical protein [Kiritimatiellia bacterium]
MQLTTKPDFDRVREMWAAYWAGDVLKRPPVVASVAKNGARKGTRNLKYYNALTRNFDAQLEALDAWVEGTEFLAESIPFFDPDHGPDQFAAFCGTSLKFSEASPNTTWVEPVVERWEDFLPIELDRDSPVWKGVMEYASVLARHGRGRYLVGMCDLHSNADALSALRGPERLCMDLYDCPDLVEQAMRQVRALFQPVYDAIYEAGAMNGETGSVGWTPFWCEGKFATIQCDFICMVSPEMARRFIIPALDEEASFLDHCVYHLDGPGALPHLDDILAIEGIDVIQWVSGAGQAPMHEWIDVLRKCQQAGKGLQIYGVNGETLKRLHKELRPEGVVYCIGAKTREDVEETCRWLERNT